MFMENADCEEDFFSKVQGLADADSLAIFWDSKLRIGQQVPATYCEEPQKGRKNLKTSSSPNLKKGRRKSALSPSKPQ